MSQENSEPYININLTSEPEKHDQEQTPEKKQHLYKNWKTQV